MTAESFFLACFLIGFLFSVVSVLMGSHGHGHAHGHGNFHVHGHGHAHGHGDSHGGDWLEKVNLITLTAFVTWFGGAGYLLCRYTVWWIVLIVAAAAIAGTAGGAVVFWFMARLLGRDFSLHRDDFDMVGVLGTVSGTVFKGGTGEIIYTRDGKRSFAAVRSEDGSSIDKGEEVVITRYEKGIGYVRRWTDLAGMNSGQ